MTKLTKVKGFSNIGFVKTNKRGQWVLLITVNKAKGGWKYASTRCVERVYVLDENPAVYKPRLDRCTFESRGYTLDYSGGEYGYSEPTTTTRSVFDSQL